MKSTIFGDVNNRVDTRNIYPSASGPTVATRASSLTPYVAGRFRGSDGSANGAGQAMAGAADAPATGGFFSKPLSWWLVLLLLLVSLMWGAQKWGSEADEFKTVRLSVYNVVIISLASMIGIGTFKVIFGKFQVPGLSDYVAAL